MAVKITVNMDKAKAHAHGMRRIARTAEMAPLDQQIAINIPGTKTKDVESSRQKIRDKYADIQTNMDEATTPEELKAAMTFL